MAQKYRTFFWGNVQTGGGEWGIQIQLAPKQRYHHCVAEIKGVSRALIYTSKERAEQVIQSLIRGENNNLEEGLVPLGTDNQECNH